MTGRAERLTQEISCIFKHPGTKMLYLGAPVESEAHLGLDSIVKNTHKSLETEIDNFLAPRIIMIFEVATFFCQEGYDLVKSSDMVNTSAFRKKSRKRTICFA